MSRIAGRLTLFTALIAASLGAAAGSASAWSPADGHPYRHGVVPQHTSGMARAPLPFNQGNAPAGVRSRHQAAGLASASNLNYGGGINNIGVTTGAPQVYVVFWGSQWGAPGTDLQGNTTFPQGDPNQVAPLIQSFFRGLGTEKPGHNWSGVMTQYCEGIARGTQDCTSGTHVGAAPPTGVLAGVIADTSRGPAPGAASGNQIAQEALWAAQQVGKPGSASRNAQYVIVSPTGTNPDNWKGPFGYCAWHDYTGDSGLTGGAASTVANAVAFTNLPYIPDVGASCGANFVNSGSAGTDDGVTIVGGHEYAETITDQFPAGGWTDTSGNENGDKCAWITPGTPGGSGNLTLSTGTFAVQTTWSNAGSTCLMDYGTPPASQGNLKLQGLPAQLAAGASASNLTVQLVDSSGAAKTAGSDIPVTLSGGTFSPTSVTIHAGQSSSDPFSYSNTKAGTATVTASSSGYGSASQNVTIQAGPVNSLSISPLSSAIAVGGSQLLTASGTDVYGNAADVSGTTWSIASGPGTVAPGPSGTTTYSSSTAGTATINATANGKSAAPATVTVNSSPIVNGGFESGAFAPWAIGGGKPNPVVVGSPVHSGSRSALLGYTPSTGEPSGDSWIQQSFKVPSASTGPTLSFWVWRYTTDTIRYDWQTCELRNSAGSRLATIFKTATTAGWQQISYSLASYRSQTVSVWCNVHEDGWGDQTYMYADDFTVG